MDVVDMLWRVKPEYNPWSENIHLTTFMLIIISCLIIYITTKNKMKKKVISKKLQ